MAVPFPPFGSGARGLDHSWAEIESDDSSAFHSEGEGDIPGSAAQIQGARGRSNSCHAREAFLPEPVQPEAQQVVQQIVPAGDRVEQGLDLFGALRTRHEVRVCLRSQGLGLGLVVAVPSL